MKTLLWKDWRQNRNLVLGMAIIAASPYVFIFGLGIIGVVTGNQNFRIDWLEGVQISGIAGMWASVLGAAFLGGNAFAGERADRSAQFLAFLPTERWRVAFSKTVVGWGVFLALWSLHTLVAWFGWLSSGAGLDSEDLQIGLLSIFIAAFLFAVGWLFSARLASPSNSAALSIGAAVVLAFGITLAADLREYRPGWGVLCLLFVLPAIVCYFAGTLHYLHRIEP